MPLISLVNITSRIGKKTCLSDINFTVSHNQQWAIIGANGSGKSALGRLLCGQLKAQEGSATLPEKTAFVSFESVTEALDQERYNDDSNVCGGADPGTAARDFILNGQPELAPQLAVMAEEFDFSGLLERGIKFLSTGEMRKAVICKALLKQPQLIVFDEPFDGLDQSSCAILKDLISKITRSGTQILLLLNRFSEIVPEITDLAYLQSGRIVLCGPREKMLASTALNRVHRFHSQGPVQLPSSLTEQPMEANDNREPVISMNRVWVRYGDKPILADLSWQVLPGEHWSISGPNGSGKTTLLNLISGENTQAYANDITLFGRKKGSGESIWEIKQRLGYISTAFQRSYRVPGTVSAVLLSGFFDSIGVYHDVSKKQQQLADQWLRLIHMEELARTPFQRLSFGEQRLVLLARAMIKQPQLLILDEPCQGLDEINREMVLKLIDILGSTGRTQILYVTHHPEDRIPCIKNSLQLVPAPDGGSTAAITRCPE